MRTTNKRKKKNMSITLKEKMASFSPEFREEVYKFAKELSDRENPQKSKGNVSKSTARPAKSNRSVTPVESGRHYQARPAK